MQNIELTVLTNSFGSELIADILIDNGSSGVAIYDTSDVANLIKSDVIWDYIEENLLKTSDIVSVKGYFPVDEFKTVYPKIIDDLEILKKNSDVSLGSLELSQTIIDDQNWLEVWKQYYKPIRVGRVVIVPRWLKYDTEDGKRAVYMDPGMAFGTGEHESTKLCLGMLEELDVDGKTVLDIGTGSGILGLAAAKLGASSVIMSDIDPIAVKSAKSNADYNDLGKTKLKILQCDLLEEGNYQGDIVLANITADILIRLSKDLGKCVKKGGRIIISGIIKARYDDVYKAFTDYGFVPDKSQVMGEWCGMRFIMPQIEG